MKRSISVTKTLSVLGILIDTLKIRFNCKADKYANVFLDHADTGYAAVRVLKI
jgi:hypothetical protein